jgi:hypothetical protein
VAATEGRAAWSYPFDVAPLILRHRPWRLPVHLSKLVLGLLAAALLSPAAWAAEKYGSPGALLTALYTPYLDETGGDDATPFFSTRLNALYAADAEATPEGEVGALDFDPVIAGQDFKISDLEIGTPETEGGATHVSVGFDNMGEKVTLDYSLVRESDGWKVDDIERKGGDYPWKLTAILAEPAE